MMNVLNTILKPDANGNCPLHGKPVWIAPGDVCSTAAPKDLRGKRCAMDFLKILGFSPTS